MYRILLTLLLSFNLYASLDPTNLKGGSGEGDGAGLGGNRGQDGGLLYIKVLGTYDGANGFIDVSGEKGEVGEDAFLLNVDGGDINVLLNSGAGASFGSGIIYTNNTSVRQDINGTISATTWEDDEIEVYNFKISVGQNVIDTTMTPNTTTIDIKGTLLPGENVQIYDFFPEVPQFAAVEILTDINNGTETIAGGGGGGPGGHGGKLVLEYNKIIGNGNYLVSGGAGGFGGRGQGDASNGQRGEDGGIGAQEVTSDNAPRLTAGETTGIKAVDDLSKKLNIGFYSGRIRTKNNYVIFEKDQDRDFTRDIFLQNFFDVN